MTTSTVSGDAPKAAPAVSSRSLRLVSLFLVAVVSFSFYFSLINIPLQGKDLDLFAPRLYLDRPVDFVSLGSEMANAPIARMAVSFLWNLSSGDSRGLRGAALFLHVVSVLLCFGLIRRWTGKPESMVAPLLGSLLFNVSPAVAAMLAESPGMSGILAAVFGFTSANLFLAATEDRNSRRYGLLALSAACALVAVGSNYGMLLLPLCLVLLDATRMEKDGWLRQAPDWAAHLALLTTTGCAWLVIHFSDAIVFVPTEVPYYWISIAAMLFLIRVLAVSRQRILKSAMIVLLNLLLVFGAVVSFQQAMDRWDPLAGLQKDDGSEGDASRAALQCVAQACREAEPELRLSKLKQAAMLWSVAPPKADPERLEGLLYARVLEDLGSGDKALEQYEILWRAFPFTEAGNAAGAGIARVLAEDKDAGRVAEVLAALARNRKLDDGEMLRQARALARLGDVSGAAVALARLDDLPEESPEGILRKQFLAAKTAGDKLKGESREKILADPQSAAGYVALAESQLISGNILQAFYWLELALRRDPVVPKAWELLGVVFAREGQPEQFIARWGALKADDPKAWMELGRKAAFTQAWDAALAYVRQRPVADGPSAEEMVALFALEQKRPSVAEAWFNKAMEQAPAAWRPRLMMADLALAMQDREKAARFLEEARQRNAPGEEITKRQAKLDGAAPAPDALAPPGGPVRTVIQ